MPPRCRTARGLSLCISVGFTQKRKPRRGAGVVLLRSDPVLPSSATDGIVEGREHGSLPATLMDLVGIEAKSSRIHQ